MDKMNEAAAESQAERDAEERHLIEDGAYEETPAEHWSKIMELAKAIELGAQDLQDQLKEFNKSAV